MQTLFGMMMISRHLQSTGARDMPSESNVVHMVHMGKLPLGEEFPVRKLMDV